MDTKKMRECSSLLPDPGGEVVRKCLDEIERLTAHILELENELAAGVHTCGPTCRKTPRCAELADLHEENERLRAHVGALQARVDALMLEFCPNEMTEEQIETWARHQRPATGSE